MSLQSTPEGDEAHGPIYPLLDAGQRLEWADSDGEQFDALSAWFNEAGAYALFVQRDGDRWEARWHRFIEPEVEAEKFTELARLLGSFLDHSRAALNYAVYQLASFAFDRDPSLRGQLNPDFVEFPIFNDPESFRKKNKIKKLPEGYRDAIEAVQPYDGRYPGLWVLHELAREFRHRVIHAAAILPQEGVTHLLINGQVILLPPDRELVPHERLEDGDVVMRFSIPGVDPDADVKPQYAVAVAIDHPLTRNLIGTSVLNQIRKDTEIALQAILDLFV
jgi:hypothetical protein